MNPNLAEILFFAAWSPAVVEKTPNMGPQPDEYRAVAWHHRLGPI